MTQKKFNLTAGSIFFFIALLHLLRLVFRWEAAIEDYSIPMWLSAVALVVAGYLGWTGIEKGMR